MTGSFTEKLHHGLGTIYDAEKIYFDSDTDHQRLVIFESVRFGRMMMLDGVTQTTEADEFIYHEMLTHVPILAHGAVRKVLIIGGGDGGMLREALRHKSVEKVTMVEIDPIVVELSRQHLPNHSQGAFDDPRTDLVFADGAAFATNPIDTYDVMIIDSTDPIGPGEVLFESGFYANTRKCLNPGGIVVTQNGVPFMQADELKGTLRHLRHFYKDASCYIATVPTYVCGPMAFGWGTDEPAHRQVPAGEIAKRYAASGLQTRYVNADIHKAAFALPNFLRDMIS